MPDFTVYYFVKWLHLVALAMGGGSAMVVLVLTGFEASREDLRGMTSLLWKRTTAWAFRLAVVAGICLLILRMRDGDHPFDAVYLHWKMVLVVLLLACSEMSGKSLLKSRYGLPMLALLFFLATTFVSVNHDAFGTRRRAEPSGGGQFTGAVQQGSN